MMQYYILLDLLIKTELRRDNSYVTYNHGNVKRLNVYMDDNMMVTNSWLLDGNLNVYMDDNIMVSHSWLLDGNLKWLM